MEEAYLWEVLLMEDHERMVVTRVRQGATVALTALQLRTSLDFCQVAPGFPGHAGLVVRAKLVRDFAATTVAVMATVDMEDILHDGG